MLFHSCLYITSFIYNYKVLYTNYCCFGINRPSFPEILWEPLLLKAKLLALWIMFFVVVCSAYCQPPVSKHRKLTQTESIVFLRLSEHILYADVRYWLVNELYAVVVAAFESVCCRLATLRCTLPVTLDNWTWFDSCLTTELQFMPLPKYLQCHLVTLFMYC